MRASHPWTRYLVAFGVTVLASAGAFAQPARLPIDGVGMMHDIAGAHETPDPTLDYRLVFDVQTLSDDPEKSSPALQAIGGLINTFARYGVPASHMHLVAVFHGKTIVLVTNDAEYAKRTGVKDNPNKALLDSLARYGLKLEVCGASAIAQHYEFASLLPRAQVNLSATVTFINLQTQGYVKIEE